MFIEKSKKVNGICPGDNFFRICIHTGCTLISGVLDRGALCFWGMGHRILFSTNGFSALKCAVDEWGEWLGHR